MQARETLADRFLAGTDWAGANRQPLAGDASRRRYERLTDSEGRTAILMIAPPDTGEDVRPFLRIARHLRTAGFSSPKVFAEDSEAGLLILEDFGDALFARLSAGDPAREAELYAAAVDLLADLHESEPPADLVRMTPDGIAQATDLAGIWYAGAGTGEADRDLAEALAEAFADIPDLASVLVLRDFHAENLIWLPDRSGSARVGLLDFQDALTGHPCYDLVSLLQDARRDLGPGVADRMTRRYLDRSGQQAGEFLHAAALFGLQRNLRILGIFARLSLSAGKSAYLDLLPRVWAHMTGSLAHPDLADLRARVLASVPPPDPAHVARLRPA